MKETLKYEAPKLVDLQTASMAANGLAPPCAQGSGNANPSGCMNGGLPGGGICIDGGGV